MPNRRPRALHNLTVRDLPRDAPDDVMYDPQAKFNARVERVGWLRLDVNLTTGTPVSVLTREIGIKITQATDDLARLVRQREDEAIVALRPRSATFIARKLKLHLDRVKNVLHRRRKGVER